MESSVTQVELTLFQRKDIDSFTNASGTSQSMDSAPHEKGEKASKEFKRSNTFFSNCRIYLGIFYSCLSSLFFSLMSVCVKKILYISPEQLTLVRNVGIFVGCLPLAVYSTREVYGNKSDRLWLVFIGFLSAIAIHLHVTAYRYLPLAEAAIIMSTTPAMTSILARFSLQEPCGLVESSAIVLTFTGLLKSIRLPQLLNNRNYLKLDGSYIGGLASAVGHTFAQSVNSVVIRKSKGVHFSVMLMYIGFIGMIEIGAIVSLTSHLELPSCAWDGVLLLLIGVFGFLGAWALVLAIQTEAAGITTVTRAAADIIMAVVLQVIFFNLIPDGYNIIGACIVMFSICVIAFKKWIMILPETSKARNMCRYLLV